MKLQGCTPESLEKILTAGVQAPSADNRHLFRFAVSEQKISIRYSEAYAEETPQRKLLAWISFGAVAENMRIQATEFGLDLQLDWFPSPDIICDLNLSEQRVQYDPLATTIPLRHTNRRFFSGPRLSSREQLQLEQQLSDIKGVKLVWLDDPATRSKALRLMRLAETERFRSASLHEEMFSSLRFDVGPRESCEVGIPIGAAEIEPPARPFFRLMRRWSTMRLLNLFQADWLVGWRAAWFPARFSPHLVLIVAEDEQPGAAIQTGRGIERVWLQANQMGWAVQPMVASVVYGLPQFIEVSSVLKQKLNEGWREIYPQLLAKNAPLMLLRLGHASVPTVRAGRPPMGSFLAKV